MMDALALDWLPEIAEAHLPLARIAEQSPGLWWRPPTADSPGWRATIHGVGQTPRCQMLRATIRAGSSMVTASLPCRFADLLLDSPVQLLSPQTLAIAGDILAGPALDALGADGGAPGWIVRCELGLPPADEPGLLVMMEWGSGGRGIGSFAGCPQLLSRLVACLPRNDASYRSVYDNLHIPARLCAGWTVLSAHEIAALQPGDAVLLDSESLALEIDGYGGWPVRIEQGCAQILGQPAFPRRMPMANPDEELPVDQIPIELSFVLHRPVITLAEARALVPGSVVPVGPLDPVRVDVMANGARIGTGRLTRMGDQAAVEISHLTAQKA